LHFARKAQAASFLQGWDTVDINHILKPNVGRRD
jgi:hypothetical protein